MPRPKLTDDSPMPYGKYKGKTMTEVPARYLLWCYDNNKCSATVREYIEDNIDVLNQEVKSVEKKKSHE